MKNSLTIISSLISLILFTACQKHEPVVDQLYYGNKPPGLIPEIYTPQKGKINEWKLGNSDSLNMQEFYFTYTGSDLFEPDVVVYRNEGSYYRSNKYSFHQTTTENSNILYSRQFFIEKTESGWSKIKSLGPMFDREDWGIMVMSVSANGTMVFDDYNSGDVLRISRIVDGVREEPKLLDEQFNSGKWTAHPFIAPDESFIIWGSEREDGYGLSDNYISFLQEDGSYGPAINMGDKINSKLVENGAKLTPDGKFLIFSRSEEKLNEDGSSYWESTKYWVDAKIIDTLRP